MHWIMYWELSKQALFKTTFQIGWEMGNHVIHQLKDNRIGEYFQYHHRPMKKIQAPREATSLMVQVSWLILLLASSKPIFYLSNRLYFWWLSYESYIVRHTMDRRYLVGSRETTLWEYIKGVPLLIVWIRRWYSNYLNLISSEAWIRPHSQSLLSVTVAHRLNTTLVFHEKVIRF